MENYNSEPQHLYVDEAGKTYLRESAGWSRFIAICTFVIMGLMILFGVFLGSLLSSLTGNANPMAGTIGGIMFTFIFIIIAALYFYPVYALYKFSVLSKEAVLANDHNILTNAFRYQKSMFKYVGILMVIVLCIYALEIIFLVVVGSVAGMHH